MLLAGLLVTALLDNGPVIAYSAQFYNPPGSHRPATHSQVYICDFDGRHRRQLTFAKGESFSVHWVGRNTLEFDRRFGYEGLVSTFRLDLRTGRERFVQKSADGLAYPSGEDPTELFARGPGGGGLGVERIDHNATLENPAAGGKVVLKDGEVFVDKDGHQVPIKFAYGAHRTYWIPKTHDLWLSSWTSNSTSGESIDIHHFDWKTLTAPKVIENGGVLDWSPFRPTWLICTPRDLMDYRRRRHPRPEDLYSQVWVSQLWVGDWKTGVKRQLVGGLAWVTSVSLRP